MKEVPITEITLRKYEPPAKMSKREMVRKLCLSLGLLQPGDSRDSIVDLLHIFLSYRKGLPYSRIEDLLIKRRKKQQLPGVTPANIHRHLRRLRELYIIEKHLDTYRLTENMKLEDIFEQKIIRNQVEPILGRIKEYIARI
ncbi:MAG: hypothetical protein ACQESG_01950 [Nanobdellota archaeon]